MCNHFQPTGYFLAQFHTCTERYISVITGNGTYKCKHVHRSDLTYKASGFKSETGRCFPFYFDETEFTAVHGNSLICRLNPVANES